MTIKEFIYKICKDVFVIFSITFVVFAIMEWFEPGFVSYYLNFNWLLLIPLIFGTVTVILDKNKIKS